MKPIVSLAAVGIAVVAALSLTVPADASSGCPTGTENFQAVTASVTPGPVPVIAQGVFTAGGVISEGATTKVTFSGGGFEVLPTVIIKEDLNPTTCLVTISEHGSMKILHGTGKFSKISGTGTLQEKILAIDARSNGKCTESKPPVAYEQMITATAKIKL